MKELAELEDAIRGWNRLPYKYRSVLNAIIAAQRLITRLKECDLGRIEWDSEELGMMAAISFDDPDEEFIGKSGKLYFVPEESET